MGAFLPDEGAQKQSSPQEIANQFDKAQNAGDVDAAANKLFEAVDGKSREETLNFLRQVNRGEQNGKGADLTVTDDGKNQFLEITSPYSKPIKATVTD